MKLARLDGGPEVFRSLQGEGSSLGLPCTFVRLSRCNLFCGYCDTPYTWNWHGSAFRAPDEPANYRRLPRFHAEAETVTRDVAEVARLVDRWGVSRVVLTGGEPLLQQRECLTLMQTLRGLSESYSFEIETNGTRAPLPELANLVHHFTVSPKLSRACVPERLRLVEPVLEDFARRDNSYFKFVVSEPTDVDEVSLLVQRLQLKPARVFLMPEARSSTELDERCGFVAAAALQNGFRFSDRLHLRLYGERRGT